MDSSIFKAYDIRGVVGENFNEEQAYIIGRALATRYPEHKRVSIGRDGRLSSAAIASALIKGLNESGTATLDIGEVPTPALYFSACRNTDSSGFMITGSHNPAQYNGIKMMVGGHTLAGDDIQQIYHTCVDGTFTQGHGSNTIQPVLDDYLSAITADVQLARPLKVAADCGNGVAGPAVKSLLQQLGCQTTCLYCEVDGRFPNHHPNPSVPENLTTLIDTVRENHLDIGLAFDGDGDRLGIVDNTGNIIWADRQMMIFAQDVLKHHPGCTIIYDVKSSRHLGEIIKAHHGTPHMSRTGHSFIKAALRETGALLAGEMSGHFFFKDRWFGFDDGLYAAARILEILARTESSCSELFDTLPVAVSTPEINIHFDRENAQHDFMRQLISTAQFDGAPINKTDGLRVEFPHGWGLVRASNTTPSLVIRFEADNETELKRLQGLFRQQLLAVTSNLKIPF